MVAVAIVVLVLFFVVMLQTFIGQASELASLRRRAAPSSRTG